MSARYNPQATAFTPTGVPPPPIKSGNGLSMNTAGGNGLQNLQNGQRTPPRDIHLQSNAQGDRRHLSRNPKQSNNFNNNGQNFNKRGHRNHRKPDRTTSEQNPNDRRDHVQEPGHFVGDYTLDGMNVSSPNKRGQVSLNHLLNFQLPPRSRPTPLPHRRAKTSSIPFNKERFINANHRFLVKPTGDYTVQMVDPDVYLDWHDILQVIMATPDEPQHASSTFTRPNCPICLSEPTSPRVTKCGHVFCYPCILHYLDMEETKGRTCPICWEMIYPRELKSVKWHAIRQLETGKTIRDGAEYVTPDDDDVLEGNGEILTLRLMERGNSSTLALPRSTTWPSTAISPHSATWYFMPDAMNFARFLMVSPEYMSNELMADLTALEVLANDVKATGGPKAVWAEEMSYIDKAKDKVQEQLEKTATMQTPDVISAQADAEMALRTVREEDAREADRQGVFDEPSDAPEAYRSKEQPPSITPQRSARSDSPSTAFHFYQSASGQQVYLHPLDIKILRSHFGNYAIFPEEIEVRVVAAEEGVMNEELRKKCKYLSHLPTGCEVTFVECDLSSVVDATTLAPFKSGLEQRRKRRQEKARREERERVRAMAMAEEEQNQTRDHGLRPVRNEDLSFLSASPTLSSPASTPINSYEPSRALDVPRTVWGTAQVPRHGEEDFVEQSHEDDGWREIDEDEIAAWETSRDSMRKGRYGEDVVLAPKHSQPSSGTATGTATPEEVPATSKKSKAKKKKLVLMSTGSRRAM